jgi:hypothetical protein
MTRFGDTCLYCRIELSGRHVAATLGPPIDGFYHIAHGHKPYQPHGTHKHRGDYHMTLADRIALGKAQGWYLGQTTRQLAKDE